MGRGMADGDSSEGFADSIVEGGANRLDRLIPAVGPGAVGEENHGDVGIKVNPQRTAAETQVADGPR